MVPAELIDLTDWKLTLPVEDPDRAGRPEEVSQPELATFADDPWFMVVGDAIAFRANAGGFATDDSPYARSELREMTAGGTEPASWSTTSGVHTMVVTEAITHLPEVKPQAVGAQLHDASNVLLMVRLNGSRLFVEAEGREVGLLDPTYTLGDRFTVRLVAADGWVKVYYDGASLPAASIPLARDGCYFKAGVYTLSNPEHGEAPDAYAQVEISRLVVTHTTFEIDPGRR